MALGFGPGSNMMCDYKANQQHRGKRKSHKDISTQFGAARQEQASWKQGSDAEIEAVRQQMLEQNRRQLKLRVVFFVAAGLGLVAVLYAILAP